MLVDIAPKFWSRKAAKIIPKSDEAIFTEHSLIHARMNARLWICSREDGYWIVLPSKRGTQTRRAKRIRDWFITTSQTALATWTSGLSVGYSSSSGIFLHFRLGKGTFRPLPSAPIAKICSEDLWIYCRRNPKFRLLMQYGSTCVRRLSALWRRNYSKNFW